MKSFINFIFNKCYYDWLLPVISEIKKSIKMSSDKEENKDKDSAYALQVANLGNVINRLPGLAESILEQDIKYDSIDTLHIFAYGSLVGNPHYRPTSMERGLLTGYQRDFCCRSVRSGASEFAGLTLGLNENEDGAVPGTILSYEKMSLEALIAMLTAYADREVTPTGIYKFEMLEVKQKDGTDINAITCIADKKSDGYVNDSLSSRARKKLERKEKDELSIWRKASLIAQADGPVGTNKSYLDRFVRYDIEKNPAVYNDETTKDLSDHEKKILKARSEDEKRMKKLIDAVDLQRQYMPRCEVERLEKVEKRQWEVFVERQESLKNPPPESVIKKMTKKLGFHL